MTLDEIADVQDRLDVLKAELDRVKKLFNGVTLTFEALEETVRDMQKNLECEYDVEKEIEREMKEKQVPEVTPQMKRLALANPEDGWVPIAEALPEENKMVVVRWQDGVVGWVYYQKSVEYPGAFVFYDNFGKKVLAPKEWYFAG